MNKFNNSCTSRVPFLTIGIASYNYAEYLPLAFEQIKKQSFTDYEVLYCDDGSTDGSTEVILGFIRDNPAVPIRLISGTNAGILANRNRILENAQGKYLMICDADDYMLENCLSELCSAALISDADCIIGGFTETDVSGRILKRHIPSPDSNKWLYTWYHAQIYKTALIRRFHIHFDELPDDVFFLQRVHLYSEKTVFVSKPLYTWVRHFDSVSSDFASNADWNPAAIWKKLSHFIESLMLQKGADRESLVYYLYKWFYLNISDLSGADMRNLRQSIHFIRIEMQSVLPDYRKAHCLIPALRTKDTCFSRMAVFLCWLLDRFGLLFFAVMIRIYQKKWRRWRQFHGKT